MSGSTVWRRLWSDGSVRVWTILSGVAAVVTAAVLLMQQESSSPSSPLAAATASAPAVSASSDPPTAVDALAPTALSSTAEPSPSLGPIATTPLFDGQVTLKWGTSVDLDAQQVVGKRAIGADGEFDLHFGDDAVLRANGVDLYLDEGPQKDAESRCRSATTEEFEGRAAVAVYGAGPQYCFLTSDGHVTWMRINTVAGPSMNSEVLVLIVRVWK